MKPRILAVLVLVLLVFVSTQMTPAAFAASTTVATYSDTACTVSSSTFSIGSTVYGSIDKLGGRPSYPITLNYVDPSGVTIKTITYSSAPSTPACDSTGYTIPGTETTGTWTLVLKDSTGATITSSNFTVSGAVPEFPTGALLLVLPLAMIYIFARRKNMLGRLPA